MGYYYKWRFNFFAERLERLMKVANGITKPNGNAYSPPVTSHDNDDSKVPKSLQRIVTREKVRPSSVDINNKKIITPPRPTSPTRYNSGCNVTVKTVIAKGITMKRVDAKVVPVSWSYISYMFM